MAEWGDGGVVIGSVVVGGGRKNKYLEVGWGGV